MNDWKGLRQGQRDTRGHLGDALLSVWCSLQHLGALFSGPRLCGHTCLLRGWNPRLQWGAVLWSPEEEQPSPCALQSTCPAPGSVCAWVLL